MFLRLAILPLGRAGSVAVSGLKFRFSEFTLDRVPIFRNNSPMIPVAGPRPDRQRMQYFVVMIDYGRRGREAIVDPEITRREVIARIVSGEYRNISFIHEIADSAVEDVTADILGEAALPAVGADSADLQAGQFDHARDLRKHEPV